MTLSIELNRDLEKQIKEEAARSGFDATTLVLDTLEQHFRSARRANQSPRHLSQQESALLQKINQGLPEEIWEEYHHLIAMRSAGKLTPTSTTNF